MNSAVSDPQLETLRLYRALIGERPDWGGALVLSCGESSASSRIPVAASIAGAATLLIENDPAPVKAAMRRAELDFVVNSLDEALRALKNEIRKHRPLSVGLMADVPATLREMNERGVLPDLLLIAPNQPTQPVLGNRDIQAMQSAGMSLRLSVDPAPERDHHRDRQDEYFLSAETAERLQEVDNRLLAFLPVDDTVRRRWLQRVPRYLREASSGGRWIWLTDDERKELAQLHAVRSASPPKSPTP
jgi:Urocanase Rossmann-like domain